MKSPRAVAKPVSQGVYNDAMEFWLRDVPNLHLGIGAKIASDVRQVTVHMMRFMYPLFTKLFEECCSGIVSASSLRTALVIQIKKRPSLMGLTWSEAECLPATIMHINTCCSLVRAYTREQFEGSASRRYPRSGGFRKKM